MSSFSGYWLFKKNSLAATNLPLWKQNNSLEGKNWSIFYQNDVHQILDDKDNWIGVAVGAVVTPNGDRLLPKEHIRIKRSFDEGLWGRYSAAFSQRNQTELVLTADQLGISNIFIHILPENIGIVFGTTLKSVIDLMDIKPKINLDYLTRHLHRKPAVFAKLQPTPVSGVTRLGPAHRIVISQHGHKVEQTWSPKSNKEKGNDSLAETIRMSVRPWASRAEKVYVSFSGGLDSSLVAWAAKEEKIKVTALHLDSRGISRSVDESVYAQEIASSLSITLKYLPYLEYLPITPPSSPNLFPDSMNSSLLIDRRTEQLAAITDGEPLLYGEGGDQVLGASSFPLFLHDMLLEYQFSAAIREAIHHCFLTGTPIMKLTKKIATECWLPKHSKIRGNYLIPELKPPGWITPALPTEYCNGLYISGSGRRSYLYSVFDYAQDLGQMTLSTSYQIEHPLAHYPIVRHILDQPTTQIYKIGQDRPYPRVGLKGLVPDQILLRRHKAEHSAIWTIAFSRNKRYIQSLIADGRAGIEGLIDIPAALKAVDRICAGQADDISWMMQLLTLEIWFRRWHPIL